MYKNTIYNNLALSKLANPSPKQNSLKPVPVKAKAPWYQIHKDKIPNKCPLVVLCEELMRVEKFHSVCDGYGHSWTMCDSAIDEAAKYLKKPRGWLELKVVEEI